MRLFKSIVCLAILVCAFHGIVFAATTGSSQTGSARSSTISQSRPQFSAPSGFIEKKLGSSSLSSKISGRITDSANVLPSYGLTGVRTSLPQVSKADKISTTGSPFVFGPVNGGKSTVAVGFRSSMSSPTNGQLCFEGTTLYKWNAGVSSNSLGNKTISFMRFGESISVTVSKSKNDNAPDRADKSRSARYQAVENTDGSITLYQWREASVDANDKSVSAGWVEVSTKMYSAGSVAITNEQMQVTVVGQTGTHVASVVTGALPDKKVGDGFIVSHGVAFQWVEAGGKGSYQECGKNGVPAVTISRTATVTTQDAAGQASTRSATIVSSKPADSDGQKGDCCIVRNSGVDTVYVKGDKIWLEVAKGNISYVKESSNSQDVSYAAPVVTTKELPKNQYEINGKKQEYIVWGGKLYQWGDDKKYAVVTPSQGVWEQVSTDTPLAQYQMLSITTTTGQTYTNVMATIVAKTDDITKPHHGLIAVVKSGDGATSSVQQYGYDATTQKWGWTEIGTISYTVAASPTGSGAKSVSPSNGGSDSGDTDGTQNTDARSGSGISNNQEANGVNNQDSASQTYGTRSSD